MTERLTMANDRYARDLGFDYGAASLSSTQAQLLEGFADGMKYGASEYNMQMYYIAHELSPRARAFFADMVAEMGHE